jgi:hypothetical protein
MNRGVRIALIATTLALLISALFFFVFLGFGGGNNNSNTSTSNSGFFSFLKNNTSNTNTTQTNTETSTTTETETIPVNTNLTKVTSREVTAFTPTTDGGVRFIERGTGQIFSAKDNTETNISSRTTQRIGEARFSVSGKYAVLGIYNESGDVIHQIATLGSASSTGNITFSNLGRGYQQVFNPTGDQVAELIKNGSNTTIETFTPSNPLKKTSLFSSSFSDWTISWPEKNTISLLTKPSGTTPGNLYLLNKNTKALSHVISSAPGLVTLTSPDSKHVLYSTTNSGGTFSTYTLNTTDGVSLISPTRTLADKCVWSKRDTNKVYCAAPQEVVSGTYPDDWYKGKVSFSDVILGLYAEGTDMDFLAILTLVLFFR